MLRSRVPFAVVLAVLSGMGVLGAACAEANLPPDDDETVPLPDRAVGAVDSNFVVDTGGDVRDAADAADAAPSSYGVFVSSATNPASFGGVDGADTVCQNLAIAAGLSGTWVAWLSTKDGTSAIDRVTSPGPWLLTTGELVAATKTELASGAIEHAIDHDEKKIPVGASRVWTGSGPDGTYLTNDCGSWMMGSLGRVGRTDAADAMWTSSEADDCTTLRHVYCFQN